MSGTLPARQGGAELLLDEGGLRRRQVGQSEAGQPRHRERRARAERDRRAEELRARPQHVRGEEARLLPAALLEGHEEERAISVERAAEGRAVLARVKGGFLSGSLSMMGAKALRA